MGCKPCKGNNAVQADGSVLDRVISQSSNEDQCLLYKLANYKKGGELIDAYNIGGQAEVEKLIREQFGILMYNDGKGQIINRAEYLRWKFRDHKHVVLPIEASLSRYDPLARWSDHPACWQMRHRGALGETLLHVLIICDTRAHTRLARILIKCFPNLALDIVEGEEYLGASALHLAIAYFNNELVQDLVEAGANVNQRAIGSFFLPRDQQRINPARHTDYEGLAYLGEYPLAWAACCANESVYNLLLDSGADPDLQDSFGNMILHMVVVCDKLDMFGYALRHPKLPASNGKLNHAGLTPLTLACKLGRAEVFKEMLELSAREFWRYSNITCSAYPLNALDTLLPDGRTNWNSALFIILNGTKEEHLDMLDGGIIQRLLEEKWKTFARKQFLKRLLILFIHLVLLSAAVYLRPEDKTEPLLAHPKDAQDALRYSCEVGTLLGVLSYVLLQQGDEVKNQGLVAFLKQLTHAPAKAIFLVSNLLILACIPYRLIGDKETEEAILVFAVPGSWFLLMFFAGAVRLTGPFVTMIYSMITGDMFTFGIIYTIVLFGFSQSFYFLYKGFPGVKNSLFGSYPSTWMALFQITLGDYSYTDLSFTTYPNLSKSVFALFMVFVPILLLNMLIAMMGNTYAHVIEQSEKEWMKQWAKIVVTLERAVPQSDAHHYLQEYSIGLGPSDDPRYEQRGVMVIKSKSKTRAKQRKGAVTNWKRVGKVTITELRKRGMTGEELRRIMWGRASISTPTKAPLKPPPDPIMQAGVQNLAVGFGEALTSALDVMAFTHNLDMTGASGLNLQSMNYLTVPNTVAQNNVANTMIQNGNVVPVSNAGCQNIISSADPKKQSKTVSTIQVPVPQISSSVQNQSQLNMTVIQTGVPTTQHVTSAVRSGVPIVQQGATVMTTQSTVIQGGIVGQTISMQPRMPQQQSGTLGQPISMQGVPQQQIALQGQIIGQSISTQSAIGQPIAAQGGVLQPISMQGVVPTQSISTQGVLGQQISMQSGMTPQMISMQGGMGQPITTQGIIGQPISTPNVIGQQMPIQSGMTRQPISMQGGLGQPISTQGMMGQPNSMQSGMTTQPISMQSGLTTQPISMQSGMISPNLTMPMSPTVQAMNLLNQHMQNQGLPVYSDPLREIIHLSDSKDSSEHEVKIKFLAVEAANLFHVHEVHPVVKPKPKSVNLSGALNMFGVDAPSGPQIDWNSGDKRLKKLSAMDPSDSEGLGEAPLLGKSARTKRARSATKRNINSATKPTSGLSRRTVKLALIGETSSSEVPADHIMDEFDKVTERYHEIQNSMLNIYRNPTTTSSTDITEMQKNMPMKDVRPVNIEHAVTSGGVHVDVITEKEYIVKGEGSGVDAESGNNEQNVKFQEQHMYQTNNRERRKTDKRKTRHRPKTAKHNRVAPILTVDDRPKHSKKRGKSASGIQKRHSHELEPSSPPDPLENWSTAGIASMNSLLSPGNESDDY